MSGFFLGLDFILYFFILLATVLTLQSKIEAILYVDSLLFKYKSLSSDSLMFILLIGFLIDI